MINKSFRFHGYGSLKFVLSKGRSFRSQLLMLKVIPNPKRKSYRLAVVVSRKVSKSAVVRNKIRRRLFEIVRSHQDKIQTPFDLVITVFSDEVATIPPLDLAKQVETLLEQSGVVKAD